MTFFAFFFKHISNFKVRDFAILDCCPDDKESQIVFSVPNLCIQTPFTFVKRKLAVTERTPIVYFLLIGLLLVQFCCKTRYFGNIAYDLQLNSLFRIN